MAEPDPRTTTPDGPASPMRIIAGSAPLRAEPREDAPLLTEAIFGEAVDAYQSENGWRRVQLGADDYVGWLPEGALGVSMEPTHRLAALRSFVFPGPSIKLPPVQVLTMGSRVSVAREEGPFAVLASGDFAVARHLALLANHEPDFVEVAERFVGVPYLWGGKTSLGLDCSGLVQVALDAAGMIVPRDSDMQEAVVGEAVAFQGADALRRGDLIFWKGHVAIARGDGTIVHANAHHMAVAVEDAAEAIARIAATDSEVRTVRRISSLS